MHEQLPDEHIKNYLQGRLTAPERAVLEALVTSEPDFARRVNLLRVEMAASELLIAADSRQLFQAWAKQKRRGAANGSTLGWKVALVVGALFLAVLVWLLLPPGNAPAPRAAPITPESQKNTPVIPETPQPPPPAPASEKPIAKRRARPDYRLLAIRHLDAPSPSAYRRVPAEGVSDAIAEAQEAYSAGEYQRALDLLAQAEGERAQSATFLAAHALFRLNRFDEAAGRFSALAEQRSRQYRYAAEWGLLLCRLAEMPEQEPAFRQQLDALLAQPEHPYWEQARELKAAMQ
ncbi:MAG: hypothetical protein KIS77_09890 [Saprospiraceae bacterium]|nr:hypothetical protein [Saprospiraceae bacterium]